MKIYSLNRIFLFKLLTINFISFILNFLISIGLIYISDEFLGFNLVSVFIIFLTLFLTLIVYPWSIKRCTENIEIHFTKKKIIVKGERYIINNVEKLSLNYRLFIFPELKLKLNDKSEINFFIEKYRKDYLDLDIVLK